MWHRVQFRHFVLLSSLAAVVSTEEETTASNNGDVVTSAQCLKFCEEQSIELERGILGGEFTIYCKKRNGTKRASEKKPCGELCKEHCEETDCNWIGNLNCPESSNIDVERRRNEKEKRDKELAEENLETGMWIGIGVGGVMVLMCIGGCIQNCWRYKNRRIAAQGMNLEGERSGMAMMGGGGGVVAGPGIPYVPPGEMTPAMAPPPAPPDADYPKASTE